MTKAQAARSLREYARALSRATRYQTSGMAALFGLVDEPEGTLTVRISSTLAHKIARDLAEIAGEIER